MKAENTSALYSRYVIDGVSQDLTPASVLDAVSEKPAPAPEASYDSIVDETVDPAPGNHDFDDSAIDSYLAKVRSAKRSLPLRFAGAYTRSRIAKALLDSIWKCGEFRLEDLKLEAAWSWDDSEVGSMAAFYDSVLCAGDHLDALDLPLAAYTFGEGKPSADFFTQYSDDRNTLPSKLLPDTRSWIVYLPFFESEYHLGGSLLSQAMGKSCGTAPALDDPDYFIDCYEVVREMVEDGVALSGITVCDGGLLAAIKAMTGSRTGASIDLSGLAAAHPDSGLVRLLFGEVPGVLLQISDSDFDYADAEFLLQDVVYYPLGHPTQGGGVTLGASPRSGIQSILDALLGARTIEGED